jgi:hypothetical protein
MSSSAPIGIQLILTKNSCRNTVIVDTSGKALYHVKTDFKFSGSTTTVKKFGDDQKPLISQTDTFSSDLTAVDEKAFFGSIAVLEKLEDTSVATTELGVIQYKTFGSTLLRLNGMEQEIRSYLRPAGFFWR